jgi:hypothetical protein
MPRVKRRQPHLRRQQHTKQYRARPRRQPAGDKRRPGERHQQRDSPIEQQPSLPGRTATSALKPSSAARLKIFEPMTTPTPRSLCPAASAVMAEAISGESAPSAVTMPSNPSEKPSRAAVRSSYAVST